jgi:hypothetical protein
VIVDDPSHSLLQRRATEVVEQPYGLLGKAQVGEQLLAVCRRQMLHGFDLDDQRLVDEEVDPISSAPPRLRMIKAC